jgi:hypothetical protein
LRYINKILMLTLSGILLAATNLCWGAAGTTPSGPPDGNHPTGPPTAAKLKEDLGKNLEELVADNAATVASAIPLISNRRGCPRSKTGKAPFYCLKVEPIAIIKGILSLMANLCLLLRILSMFAFAFANLSRRFKTG